MTDLNKVLDILAERGLLDSLDNKRLTTSKLPITLYIKLLRSELATGKDLASNVGTALFTYANRNGENHDQEVYARALRDGVSPEEFLADFIEEKLRKTSNSSQ
jgi:hypothetical protein